MNASHGWMLAGCVLAGGAMLTGCGEVKGEAAGQAEQLATGGPAELKGSMAPQGDSAYARKLDGVRLAYDAVLENLAHAQTPGYQAVRPVFPDADANDGPLDYTPDLHRDPRPGQPVLTGRWLDVAVRGNGYLILDDPASGAADGLSYVRTGNLYINLDHELVHGSPDGPRVEPIVIFPDEYTDLRIESDGVVYAQGRARGPWMAVGQLHLARFANHAGLYESTTGRRIASAESGPPIVGTPGEMGLGTLLQKHLEGSNVDLAEELAELERLKAWGRSLASALNVDPGFREAPLLALTDERGARIAPTPSSLSAGR